MKKELSANEAFLMFPIWKTGVKTVTSITLPEKEGTTFRSIVGDGTPFRFSYIPISGSHGKSILVEGDPRIVSIIRTTQESHDAESLLAFHYRPSWGWINDPNGLVFANGVYHLYHQYNPVGENWENMSWGHATSTDLVIWKEKAPVLFPDDETHTIFSGSGIQEGQTLYFPYTRSDCTPEEAFSQCLAISDDGGMTLHKQGIIIPTFHTNARDPKVFHFNGKRYLLLWMKDHRFGLFEGRTWHAWTLIEEFDAPPCWECPDLWFLGNRIAFTAAEGCYRFGTFDGRLHLEDQLHHLYLTNLPYAAQSFNGTKEGTTIISWLRTKQIPGVMSLPRRLVCEDDGIHAYPPVGFDSYFSSPVKHEGRIVTLPSFGPCAIHIACIRPWTLSLGSWSIRYDPKSGKFSGNEECVFPSRPDAIELLFDGPVLEVTSPDCRDLAYFEIPRRFPRLRLESGGQIRLRVVPFKKQDPEAG